MAVKLPSRLVHLPSAVRYRYGCRGDRKPYAILAIIGFVKLSHKGSLFSINRKDFSLHKDITVHLLSSAIRVHREASSH
jgi:hypothetical protein